MQVFWIDQRNSFNCQRVKQGTEHSIRLDKFNSTYNFTQAQLLWVTILLIWNTLSEPKSQLTDWHGWFFCSWAGFRMLLRLLFSNSGHPRAYIPLCCLIMKCICFQPLPVKLLREIAQLVHMGQVPLFDLNMLTCKPHKVHLAVKVTSPSYNLALEYGWSTRCGNNIMHNGHASHNIFKSLMYNIVKATSTWKTFTYLEVVQRLVL